MKKIILIALILVNIKLFSQTEKWGFLAVNSTDNKEYLISKIKQISGIRYIGYCPDHQLVFFKYDTAVFNKVSDIYTELINNDNTLNNIIVLKSNADDESAATDIINYCSFDETTANMIKNELNKK